MMNIGFTTVTFRKKSVDEVLKIAEAAGVNCIEWGGDIHMPPEETEKAFKLREKTEKTGIPTVSYGTYYRVGENNTGKFKKICDIAEILGAKIIRIWLGTKSSCETTEEEFLQMVEEVKMLADIAAKSNLTVAFEFHHSTYNDNADNTVKFIKSCNRSNVKTYWQPFTTEADTENLKKVLPYLVTVHVFNWDKDCNRFMLSEGISRWKEFFKIIKDNGVSCNYILEFTKDDNDENFIEDIKCLKEMLY